MKNKCNIIKLFILFSNVYNSYLFKSFLFYMAFYWVICIVLILICTRMRHSDRRVAPISLMKNNFLVKETCFQFYILKKRGSKMFLPLSGKILIRPYPWINYNKIYSGFNINGNIEKRVQQYGNYVIKVQQKYK
jgi:hypothetical protein